ncbi:hypothetical protein MMC21_001338 [Puttea exsequens]|nr:hypothetical protein [Puttea exsequens]
MDFFSKLLPFAREPTFLDKAWMALRYPYDLVQSPLQALASIPTLSLLVIPAFSSYGTSINLLFFYMTWAILVRSNDPLRVELLGTLGVRLLFYVAPSLWFLVFDSATPNLAMGMKEHEEIALPMSEGNGGKKGRWWKIALVSVFNVLLGVVVQIGLEALVTQVLNQRSLLKVTIITPFPWSIAKDLILGLLLREAFTYILHRYLLHADQHSPRLTRLHKRLSVLHTTWQHSMPAPFSLVAHYDNPVVYLIHVFLPMYLPAVLLRMHLLTYHIYLALVSLEETFVYSGYNVLPSAFILGGMARRKERHLMGNGDGNYGCFGLADVLMGTSVGTDLVDDVVDEAEEKQVGQKAKKKARAVGRRARGKKKTIEPPPDKEEEEEEEQDDAEPTDEDPHNDGNDEEADKEERHQERPKRNNKKNSDENDEEQPPQRKSGRPRKASRKSDDDKDKTEEKAEEEPEEMPSPSKRKPPKLGRKGSKSKKASEKA